MRPGDSEAQEVQTATAEEERAPPSKRGFRFALMVKKQFLELCAHKF